MTNRKRNALWILLGLQLALPLAAAVRVIDETAIPYTGFLRKAEFDQRFPGELHDDPSALQSGWYVVYTHQALQYCFGPIALESTGRDYFEQLEVIVGQAVDQRPGLADHTLRLEKAPFPAGGFPPPGAQPSDPDQAPAQEKNPAGKQEGFSLWRMIKGWFGM